ncbi:alpha/beta fold hydrolase [Methylibium sp.]|uniref:alpha/beta fold hydrolase n=1 Tax=Methylibium sp. TaxID=2067992 RepID=UPI003D113F6B
MSLSAYTARRTARSEFVAVRGLRYHAHVWGAAPTEPDRPPLLLMHGWMDVGASFQFVVDAMADNRHVIAPDWRGFGRTEIAPATDSYWFADYLGDLDALLDHFSPGRAVDLLGHSMGGNVAMIYAGVRPERVRRLVNLEGFGMPRSLPAQAPTRYATWLDELKAPQGLRDYGSLDEVAERLRRNNPRLAADRAAWLAPHWARQGASGRWDIQGDPAHKRTNPVLYRVDEVLACWARIAAPLLWVEGRQTDVSKWWGDRYPRSDFEERMATLARTVAIERVMLEDAGHMLHHDQPQVLAEHIERFLDAR